MTGSFLLVLIVTSSIVLSSCGSSRSAEEIGRPVQLDPDMQIVRLSENVWVHIATLRIPDYGTFPCNGMIYIRDGEAAVFDSPIQDRLADMLIEWIREERKAEPVALVVNHFHDDCTGGMARFLDAGIPVYGNERTCDSLSVRSEPCPSHTFATADTISVGTHQVINAYFGPAHSPDNIVSYLPDEKVLFGGCMMKEVGAGYGNLADADTIVWPITVERVSDAFPAATTIIPGHGKIGGREILEYTQQMFESNHED